MVSKIFRGVGAWPMSDHERMGQIIDQALAAAFARVAVANIERRYPHKLDHLVTSPDDLGDHVALHPVFCGSYDWHSAVHMHWLAVRMLRLFPEIDAAVGMGSVLARQLTPAGCGQELAYLQGPAGKTFERPYGWAWLLALRAELAQLEQSDPRAAGWAAAIEPLAREVARRLTEFVGVAPYPVRSGTHANTAFACLLAGDFARDTGDADLAAAIRQAAGRWFDHDRAAAVAFEPSLTDFLSPILCEAALMADVLPAPDFGRWLAGFLPAGPSSLARPPEVADRSDPQIAHLDGLSLSRAWCLRRIAAALPVEHPHRDAFRMAAEANLEAGLPHTVGGDYVGEHWLASFAALALGVETNSGREGRQGIR
jgi:hypothetical protein